METAGSGGRYRLGRLGSVLLLLVPLLGVAAAGPGSAEPQARPADAAATRVADAGTPPRSLGPGAPPPPPPPQFGARPPPHD
ncbi:hypothetical protein ACFW7O_29435, partial [Streptomyces diastatochromogenes]